MSENEKMQKLHQKVVIGEFLTQDEQIALQNWYDALDKQEDLLFNNSQQTKTSDSSYQYLENATNQVAKLSLEIENLISQNAEIKKENQRLKTKLESHLLEKVA